MIIRKNKKNLIRRPAVTWFFVLLLASSFLFGGFTLAAQDYTKATVATPIASGSNTDSSSYDKSINGTLSAVEWNGLAYDFVKTWATSTMVGPLGIGTAASPSYILDVNGSIRATSFSGAYTGTINAGNVSNGAFGSNLGGGNFSFPGRLGIGTTNANVDLQIGSLASSQVSTPSTISLGGTYSDTPTANVKLRLYDTGDSLSTYGLSVSAAQFEFLTASDAHYSWFIGGNEKLRLSNGGYLGIGTTNPTKLLTISAGANPTLRFVDTGNRTWDVYPNGGIFTISDVTSAEDRLVIDGAGNVGIGTTAPGNKLDVVGGLNAGSGESHLFQGTYFDPVGGTLAAVKISQNAGLPLPAASFTAGINGTAMANYNTYGGYFNNVSTVSGSGINYGLYVIGANNYFSGNLELNNNKSIIASSASANTTILLGNYADGLGFYYGTSTQATNKTASLAVEGDVKANRLCIQEDCKAAWSDIVSAGGGNQWITSGNDIHNYNIGGVAIGTSTPGVYKLNVNGDTNISGTITATNFSGTYGGTIGAPNVSSGSFASNTGGGNFSFPANVGIGTTDPGAYKLNVNGDVKFGTNVVVGGATMLTEDGTGILKFGLAGGAQTAIYSASSEAIRILANGNVGIGTTDPGAYKLNVNGDTNITGNLNVTGSIAGSGLTGLVVGAANVSSGEFGSNTSGGNFYFGATVSGNLGVGTTVPINKLSVVGGAVTVAGSYTAQAGANVSLSQETNYAQLQSWGSKPLYINPVGNNVIFNGGSVGIGTANPNAKLTVGSALTGSALGSTFITNAGSLGTTSGNTLTLANIGFLSGNVSSLGVRAYRTSAGTQWDTTALAIGMDVDSSPFVGGYLAFRSGNVGIGTTNPSDILTVASPNMTLNSENPIIISQVTGYTRTSGIYNTIDTLSGLGTGILFKTYKQSVGSYDAMKIRQDGNVGIGITDPGVYKLNVNGNTNITGNLNVTGSISGSGLTGLVVSAANVSSGAFASNTGLGNFTFPGSVGIGTTNSQATLDVSGASAVLWVGPHYGNPDRDYIKLVADGTDTAIVSPNERFNIYNDDGIISLQKNGGNVGIGTTDPQSKLHISAGGSSSSILWGLTLNNDNNSLGAEWGSGIKFHNALYSDSTEQNKWSGIAGISDSSWSNSTALAFYTNPNAAYAPIEVMRINSSGNVGINTTNPGAYKLNVNGNTNITGALNVTGTITGGGALTGTINAGNVSSGDFASNTGGGNFSFPGNIKLPELGGLVPSLYIGSNTVSDNIYQIQFGADATNQFGMGYYTSAKSVWSGRQGLGIHVAGTSEFSVKSSGWDNLFGIQGLTGNAYFKGAVGIGTTNPSGAKLVVTGSSVPTGRQDIFQLEHSGQNTFLISAFGQTSTVTPATVQLAAWNSEQNISLITDTLANVQAGGSTKGIFIKSGGNVGINTTNPTEAKLVINAGTGMALKAYGDGIFTGTLQTQTGSDFAEEFATTYDLEPGTVVVMDDNGYKSVRPCTESYDNTVVGIVSNNPSIIAGRINSEHKAIIAMMGVVKVKVIDINGKISKGDMLTTSSVSGYAMKSDNSKPGTIIGKALENLNQETGEINVLVNLQ